MGEGELASLATDLGGLLAAFALCVVVATAVALCVKALRGRDGGVPPVRAHRLMTPMEREVCTFIEEAVPYARVHAQVSMGAILSAQPGLDRKTYAIVRSRFSSKRVDFVLEDRVTGEVIALVELDDRTHDVEADIARDRMTGAAGYLTIRLPASERPTAASVRARLNAALGPRRGRAG